MTTLEQSWSAAEICRALDISDRQLTALITGGKVGYYRGKRGTRRFFAEHVEEIRSALEVKAQQPVSTDLSGIGATRGAVARRRSA